MAVFTQVSSSELEPLLSKLNLGQLLHLTGCTSGIENTNYFVTTSQGEFVLTLFERLTATQLPFYLNLMQHLAHKGIPVPSPQADKHESILHTLKEKPAAVVTRLKGSNQMAPTAEHCHQVGAMLARMHIAAQDYSAKQINLRGLLWWQETVPLLLPFLQPAAKEMMIHELAHHQSLASSSLWKALPYGPIHADLFRDNVMFEGAQLQGFFDFYFAGCDTFVYDIAVCLNDWCIDWSTGALDSTRAQVFVQAYDALRPLSDNEQEAMSDALRAAAFRFWISRLWDWHLPRNASLLKPHDPMHFEQILTLRRTNVWQYKRPAFAASPN